MSTTPSAGNVSRPEKGGARIAPSGEQQDHEAEEAEEPALIEHVLQATPREPFERAHPPDDERDRLARHRGAQLALAESLRQPDLIPPRDHLEREEDRHDFEDVGDATRRNRERGREHQQGDRDCERTLVEHVVERAEGLRIVSLQPLLELVAEHRLFLHVPFVPQFG